MKLPLVHIPTMAVFLSAKSASFWILSSKLLISSSISASFPNMDAITDTLERTLSTKPRLSRISRDAMSRIAMRWGS